MYEYGFLVLLLVLALFVVFPVYVLVRLAEHSRAIAQLKQRLLLGRLERAPGEMGAIPAEPVGPPREPTPRPEIAELARRVATAEPATTVPGTPSERVVIAPPEPPRRPPSVPAQPAPARPDFESVVGANWLLKVGMAAIVLATAFFLKYAFESGLIGDTARVGMGLVGSAVLLGLGQFLLERPGYRTYAQVLTSGGIVILFLSIYAAYNLYHFIGFTLAFAVLAAAAVGASAVAMANNTQAVALLCMLGAFMTPVLIQREGVGGRNLLDLYAYMAGLNLWGAALVRFRPWHSLTALTFAGTWVLFFGAGGLHGRQYLPTEAFAVVFLLFACYGGVAADRARTGEMRETAEMPEMSSVGLYLILGGCVAFVVASALILAEVGALGLPAMAPAGVFVALLMAALALAFPGIYPEHATARRLFRYLSALALGLVMCITVAYAPPTTRAQVPLAFAFGLFSYLVFLAVAIHMRSREGGEEPAVALVAANTIAHVAVAFHALEPLRIWGIHAAVLWLPLAGWIAVVALWIVGRGREASRYFAPGLAIAAQSLLLVALALGAYLAYYHDAYHWPPIRGVALFGAEFVVVSATWIAARRVVSRPGFRADLLAAFVNAAAFFGLLAVATRMQPYGGFVLLCGCAIGMAAYHAYVGGSVLRRPEDDPLSRFVYLGLALTFVTIAIPLQLRASYVTLAWAVEGAVLVWTGVIAAERRVRWAGLALLAVTAAKALCWDISQPLDPFRLLLNTRMLSGASVVAALYVSAWLLWQRRDALPEEERPAPVALVLVANLFTLIFVSLDLWDYVGQQRAEAAGASAQQLALSLFWSAYALAAMSAGIWRRARAVRLFALGLLITAVTKVFVFDLSSLDVPYRIVSFFVLGLILLAVALLYTRFESRLR